MSKWLKRVRGAIAMGLTWAVVWAPIGVLIGMIVDRDGSMDEPWLLIGAYPGFLGGVVFATVLGIAGRRHRFEELSIPRFAAWGAAAGLLVGSLPFAVSVSSSGASQWLLGGIVIGSITLLSAASAGGSLALARRAERRELSDAGCHAKQTMLSGVGDGEREAERGLPK